ncbi:MAG: pyridoxamine 5'-phosphate oxidase family protein [Desulfobacterales bacterium]|jgi:nitroimidazol reductase NimA-like FMN-containing flavoprotein (pyridoxamine 5'-phosphate oxidase superfamily)|nr:pyridoxamine 5'-phosphate oxidase family protein [Desulfobacterales bacterium]
MLAEMKQLLRGKTICVLATVAGSKPHCSLMAYATNEDGTEIYMATRRSTKKFRNLCDNPAVSLLIDTREATPRDLARSLTVDGVCTQIEGASQKQIARDRLLSVHPHLDGFLSHAENEMLCVKIQSFLLLKGLTEAYHITLA